MARAEKNAGVGDLSSLRLMPEHLPSSHQSHGPGPARSRPGRSGQPPVIPDPDRAFRARAGRAIHAIFTDDLVPTGCPLRYTGRNRATPRALDRGDPKMRLVLPTIHFPRFRSRSHSGMPPDNQLRPGKLVGNRKTGWIDTHGQKGVAPPPNPSEQREAGHSSSSQAMVAEAQRRGFDVMTAGRCEVWSSSSTAIRRRSPSRRRRPGPPHEPTPA